MRRAIAATFAFAEGAVRVRRISGAETVTGLVVGVTTRVKALARLASNAAEPARLARAPATMRCHLVAVAPLLALLDAAVLEMLGAAATKVTTTAFAKGTVLTLAAFVAERLARLHAGIAVNTRVADCELLTGTAALHVRRRAKVTIAAFAHPTV